MKSLLTVHQGGARLFVAFGTAVLILAMLSLIHQAQRYVPDNVPLPYMGDLDNNRQVLISTGPQSLPEMVYRELGPSTERLDPTGGTPIARETVAMVLYPQCQAPALLVTDLVKHVQEGGRLVVFSDTEMDLLGAFGLGSIPLPAPVTEARAFGPTVEVMHVAEIEAPATRALVAKPGTTLIPLLESNGHILAGMVKFGSGSVTAVTVRLSDYDYVEKKDNAIFLANLILESRGQARPAHVKVLDFNSELLRNLYLLQSQRSERIAEALRRWHYDSLWELIKANPTAAAFLQLLLGLLVFGISRARRLGAPLPEDFRASELPDPLATRALAYSTSTLYQHAMARGAYHVRDWLSWKLGLGSAEPTSLPAVQESNAVAGPASTSRAADIAVALEKSNPGAYARFVELNRFLAKTCSPSHPTDEKDVARMWQLIDELRRELN